MTSAFDHGLADLRAGNLSEARFWLERARRLNPADSAAALALGSVLIRQRDPQAVALHQEILLGGRLNEALCGLAAAQRMVGDHLQAALSRSSALRHFALNSYASQHSALDAYCAEAGALGWCGFVAGKLALSLLRPGECGAIRIKCDGVDVWEATAPAEYQTIDLPLPGPGARRIVIEPDHGWLLGQTIDIGNILRVEGMAYARNGGLHGWAWCPHDPDYAPELVLARDDKIIGTVLAEEMAVGIKLAHPLARPRGFSVSADRLGDAPGLVEIRGRDGRNIYGAPIDPSAWQRSAAFAARSAAKPLFDPGSGTAVPEDAEPDYPLLCMPAAIEGKPAANGTPPEFCTIVVPVYGARAQTLQCLDSVIASCPPWARVLVVDDASPDDTLTAALDALAKAGSIHLVRHTQNRGFPASVNTGLARAAGQDVVLLNSDTLLPECWLERLRAAAYSAADIGTVTPISNEASVLSYPDTQYPNPVPDQAQTRILDGFAQGAETLGLVDIPTAVGFCMFIKWDCLKQTGGLREDVFAQGYGEENDFCIRARHLGWRHVAAPGIFVGHVGGRSFGGPRQHLMIRNQQLLNDLHPGYDFLVQDFLRARTLIPSWRAIDTVRWKAGDDARGAVLLITHGRQGGVRRRVIERAQALRSQGVRPICLWPAEGFSGGKDCVLGDGPEGGFPNLRFALPDDLHLVAALLSNNNVQRIEVHSLIGHHHAVLGLSRLLGVPYDMVIHDYACFCPRLTLITGNGQFCGEPDEAACEACVADHGQQISEDITVADLRMRSAAQLSGASTVIVPSRDVASRIKRRFTDVDPVVTPWEAHEAGAGTRFERRDRRSLRVCIVGAVGVEKGFDVLLACVRDAARRRLNLDFVVVGYTSDDQRLLASGRVRITGIYREEDVIKLVKAQNADIVFLPSIVPETWSYTLSEAWNAGLPVLAFDIGAQAERIRRAGTGWLLPHGTAPAAINNLMITLL